MNPSFLLKLMFDNFLFWVHEKRNLGIYAPGKRRKLSEFIKKNNDIF